MLGAAAEFQSEFWRLYFFHDWLFVRGLIASTKAARTSSGTHWVMCVRDVDRWLSKPPEPPPNTALKTALKTAPKTAPKTALKTALKNALKKH